MSIDNRLPVQSNTTPESLSPSFALTDQEEAGMSMAQVFAIIWAHKKESLIIAVVLIALFAGLIKLLPKSYNAQASIIVNYEANDPLLGEQAFPAGLMDSYIATQVELIQSSSVLLPVIERLKLTDKEDVMAGYNGAGTKEDWVKAQLIKNLTINHPNYTQLIYIAAESRSAEEAAQLANTVADVYLGQQQQRLNTPAIERANKYSDQLASLKEKVAAAQEKVAEFRQRNGLTDVAPDNNDAEAAHLRDLEQKHQDAINVERAALVAKTNNRDVGRAAAQSAVVQNLRIQLSNMKTVMAQLKTTYGSNHPRVVELQSQIDATQAAIDKELSMLGTDSNADLTTIHDLAARYKAAADAQRVKVLALRRIQDEGGKLITELESAQAVYRQGLDGYERILAAAGGQSSNLRLMNSAEVPIKSSKPNKLKLLILAVGASLLFGIALPFAYDFLLHRKIRCRDDIENELRLTVLAEFEACPELAGSSL